ncbi:MAG TPA: biotin/lipoyl-containing protein [Rubrivivax sp.]|nr:biotin/lipoyl-containing protein [Rubrivivax sp.]
MKLNITVEGRLYEVDVEVAEADHAVLPPSYPVGTALLSGQVAGAPVSAPTPPGAATPKAVADEAKVCRSPVAGIVVKVTAQAGQTLQVGDSLLVLEAMKMETEICAPVSGKVTSMKLKPGDNVQAGEVVVEFE